MNTSLICPIDQRKTTSVEDQVFSFIKQKIDHFQLIPGKELPHIQPSNLNQKYQKELMKKVFLRLKEAGYLTVDANKEWIVQRPNKITSDVLTRIVPIYQAIEATGKKPKIVTLNQHAKVADHSDVTTKGFLLKENYLEFTRLYYGDDELIAYATFSISLDLVPTLQTVILNDYPHLQQLLHLYPGLYHFHTRELQTMTLPMSIQDALNRNDSPMSVFGDYSFYTKFGRVIEKGVVYMLNLYEFSSEIPDAKILLSD
jgi:DNA-binding GntR family transcriptional regulator